MKLRNLVSVAAIAAAALSMPATESFAQPEEPLVETVPVLQGGFAYIDSRTNKSDFSESTMTMLSDGAQVLSGGRIRQVEPGLCTDIVWSMGGASKIDRSDKIFKMKQKNDLDITFAFFSCANGVPVCRFIQSNTVEVPKCSATNKTNAKQTVSKLLPPVGQSKFQCKNGIEITSEAFGLPTNFQDLLLSQYPDIRDELKLKFSDDTGAIISTAAAATQLAPGLGLPLCP